MIFINIFVLFVVTILILIDGFLQCLTKEERKELNNSHNPYFNRWFSAIRIWWENDYILPPSQSLF